MNGTFAGRRQRKHNGDQYLTGQVRYTADLALPRMTHLALVRSPHAHARIAGVDARAAEAHATVVAVMTGAQAAEVSGPILSLVSAMTGRKAPVDDLTGDGVATLRSRG